MPSSSKDRYCNKYEVIYMLTKNKSYNFNLDPVRRPHTKSTVERANRRTSNVNKWTNGAHGNPHNLSKAMTKNELPRWLNGKGANPGDVWSIPTQGYRGAHFAAFPERLVERMLLCSTSVGDLILDPFGGAGTTAKIAIQNRRKAISLDMGYHELQNRTDKQYTVKPGNMNGDPSMFRKHFQ